MDNRRKQDQGSSPFPTTSRSLSRDPQGFGVIMGPASIRQSGEATPSEDPAIAALVEWADMVSSTLPEPHQDATAGAHTYFNPVRVRLRGFARGLGDIVQVDLHLQVQLVEQRTEAITPYPHHPGRAARSLGLGQSQVGLD